METVCNRERCGVQDQAAGEWIEQPCCGDIALQITCGGDDDDGPMSSTTGPVRPSLTDIFPGNFSSSCQRSS